VNLISKTHLILVVSLWWHEAARRCNRWFSYCIILGDRPPVRSTSIAPIFFWNRNNTSQRAYSIHGCPNPSLSCRCVQPYTSLQEENVCSIQFPSIVMIQTAFDKNMLLLTASRCFYLSISLMRPEIQCMTSAPIHHGEAPCVSPSSVLNALSIHLGYHLFKSVKYVLRVNSLLSRRILLSYNDKSW
jgi:hypothetical protein